ncbi:unnamed protein product [Gongylonema pulchrum]|uniref:Unconventional myosin-XVIIIa n=1 Tax=Gongylonema pulchrum TaxID=637853 RepID=A0A183E0G7_9BILA|nr:unnamed protein product [Gongylonema pulchrum]
MIAPVSLVRSSLDFVRVSTEDKVKSLCASGSSSANASNSARRTYQRVVKPQPPLSTSRSKGRNNGSAGNTVRNNMIELGDVQTLPEDVTKSMTSTARGSALSSRNVTKNARNNSSDLDLPSSKAVKSAATNPVGSSTGRSVINCKNQSVRPIIRVGAVTSSIVNKPAGSTVSSRRVTESTTPSPVALSASTESSVNSKNKPVQPIIRVGAMENSVINKSAAPSGRVAGSTTANPMGSSVSAQRSVSSTNRPVIRVASVNNPVGSSASSKGVVEKSTTENRRSSSVSCKRVVESGTTNPVGSAVSSGRSVKNSTSKPASSITCVGTAAKNATNSPVGSAAASKRATAKPANSVVSAGRVTENVRTSQVDSAASFERVREESVDSPARLALSAGSSAVPAGRVTRSIANNPADATVLSGRVMENAAKSAANVSASSQRTTRRTSNEPAHLPASSERGRNRSVLQDASSQEADAAGAAGRPHTGSTQDCNGTVAVLKRKTCENEVSKAKKPRNGGGRIDIIVLSDDEDNGGSVGTDVGNKDMTAVVNNDDLITSIEDAGIPAHELIMAAEKEILLVCFCKYNLSGLFEMAAWYMEVTIYRLSEAFQNVCVCACLYLCIFMVCVRMCSICLGALNSRTRKS